MKLTVQRKVFNTEGARTTIGELFIDGEFFCYTAEDEVRPDNIKVQDKTAIPTGEYKVIVNMSNRFKREMALIYNTKDLTVQKGSVKFAGVRIHGGNDATNSSGCILVAHNVSEDNTRIHGSAEKELTAILKGAIKKNELITLDVQVKICDGLSKTMI